MKNRKKNQLQKRKKRKKDDEDMSWKEVLRFAFCLSIALVVGWLFMMSGVDGEIEGGVIEHALEEPYYTWIQQFLTVYWTIGIAAIIGWIIVAKLAKHKSDWALLFSIMVPVLLLGIALIIDFLISLIKLNAPQSAALYGGIFLFIVILQSVLFFLKRNGSEKVLDSSFLILGLLAAFLIGLADPVAGNMIVKLKSTIIEGFGAKLLFWVIGVTGSFLFIGVYHFVLKELREAGIDSLSR